MFYDEFIMLCNSVGKTPTTVAKEIGLKGAHVTKWKNGSTPTDVNIFKVCDYFGVPHNYFSSKKEYPSRKVRSVYTDEDYEIVKQFCTYDKTQLQGIEGEEKMPTLTSKDERNDINLIKIAGRDGSYIEKRVSDEQLALFQSMLAQMKPVDDEV